MALAKLRHDLIHLETEKLSKTLPWGGGMTSVLSRARNGGMEVKKRNLKARSGASKIRYSAGGVFSLLLFTHFWIKKTHTACMDFALNFVFTG